jgi:hypothetical protein
MLTSYYDRSTLAPCMLSMFFDEVPKVTALLTQPITCLTRDEKFDCRYEHIGTKYYDRSTQAAQLFECQYENMFRLCHSHFVVRP